MDLLDQNRSLIHTGKLLRQPDSGLNGWSELFVILFDNYCKIRSSITCETNTHLVRSGHDETEGKGWCHEIHGQSKSMLWDFLLKNFTNA